MTGTETGAGVEWLDGTEPDAVEFDSQWRRRWPFGRRTTAALIAVVVVGASLVGWRVSRQPPLKITVAGVSVHDPGAVLARAEREFRAYANDHRGALGPGSRCFFARLAGARRSDVALTLQCGPVAFYGDDPRADYLGYPLTSSAARHGSVTLTVSANPLVPTPATPPALTTLVRPDRRAPVPDRLVPPTPPPAPADLLVDLGPGAVNTLPSLPPTAVLGSYGAIVTVLSSGVIPGYGRHESARSAPPGQKLFAFDLLVDAGDTADTRAIDLDIGISVDNGPPRPLTITGEGVIQDIVAAVPKQAHSIDLVLTDSGTTQRISLLTGVAAPGAITVYQRGLRQVGLDLGTQVGARLDGHVVDIVFTANTATLEYFGDTAHDHPPRVDQAFLSTDVCGSVGGIDPIDSCESPGSNDVRLEVTDAAGKVTSLRPTVEPTSSLASWVVPANYQSGVLVITSLTLQDGRVARLDTPLRVPILIPLR